MHKPHTNQTLVEFNTSSSSFHLQLDTSPTVPTPQGQRKVLTEDTQCSSRIRSLKTAEASEIYNSLWSLLSHCPHPPSCSTSIAATHNTQAINS